MFYLVELFDDDLVTYSFFGYGFWHSFGSAIMNTPLLQAIANGPAATMLMHSSLWHHVSSLI